MAVGSLTRDNARHSNSNSQPGGSHGQEDPVRRRRSHWELHRVVPVKGRPRRDARRSRGPSRSETIRKKGISVTGPHDPFETHPKALHLNESQRMPRDFDLAFVAMKVYDTAWAAQLALRHLQPRATSSRPRTAGPIRSSAVGGRRLALARAGHVEDRRGAVEAGRRSSAAPRRARAPGTTSSAWASTTAGSRARQRSGRDAQGDRRLAGRPTTSGASAGPSSARTRWATRCRPCRGSARPRSPRAKWAAQSRSISARSPPGSGWRSATRCRVQRHDRRSVGRRRPAWTSDDTLDRMLTPTSAGGRNWRASMGQDVTKGRPTEIDYMNGYVVAQGRERGVPTPVSRRPSRPSVRSTPVRASRTPRTSVSCSSAPGV